jgi:hypothetical protein
VERAVHLAIGDALDLARLRGGRLVRVVLSGHADVGGGARAFLDDLGLADVEVTVDGAGDPPRLSFVELAPRP